MPIVVSLWTWGKRWECFAGGGSVFWFGIGALYRYDLRKMETAICYHRGEVSQGLGAETLAFYRRYCKGRGRLREYRIGEDGMGKLSNPEVGKIVVLNAFDKRAMEAVVEIIGSFERMPDFLFDFSADFDLGARSWRPIERLLKRARIKFICRSECHKNLLEHWIKTRGIVKVVDGQGVGCRFDPSRRAAVRRSLGITPDAVVFCYTGEISREANVLEMLGLLKFFIENIEENAYLILSGFFDDSTNRFLGCGSLLGQYYNEYVNFLKEDGRILEGKVVYIGEADGTRLEDIYGASDYFLSLATPCQGRRFGQPLRALGAGLPCILSRWGVHKDLEGIEGVRFVSVSLQDGYLKFDKKQFLKRLFFEFAEPATRSAHYRRVVARDARRWSAGRKAGGGLLRHGRYFTGFKDTFFEYCRLVSKNPYAPFAGKGWRYAPSYGNIYGSLF